MEIWYSWWWYVDPRMARQIKKSMKQAQKKRQKLQKKEAPIQLANEIKADNLIDWLLSNEPDITTPKTQ